MKYDIDDLLHMALAPEKEAILTGHAKAIVQQAIYLQKDWKDSAKIARIAMLIACLEALCLFGLISAHSPGGVVSWILILFFVLQISTLFFMAIIASGALATTVHATRKGI